MVENIPMEMSEADKAALLAKRQQQQDLMGAATRTKGNFPGERYTVESHSPDPNARTEGMINKVPGVDASPESGAENPDAS